MRLQKGDGTKLFHHFFDDPYDYRDNHNNNQNTGPYSGFKNASNYATAVQGSKKEK